MSNSFPKRYKTDTTAEFGVNLVSTIVNDHLGWIFRRTHQEHDFGIDGYIDYVSEDNSVTGNFIAVQIKTGKSYLTENGNNHWYSDTKAHLNYFLNSPVNVLLIICDPQTHECFWAKLDKDTVDYNGDRWRHPIPKNQKLNIKYIDELKKNFGNIKDNLQEFEQDNEILKLIDKDSFIQYSVPKSDILRCDTGNLETFIKRITRNEKLTLAVQGKLYIATYGYEFDKRETHQIKEVKRWAAKARKNIRDWYLCACDEPRLSTLKWIAACTCGLKAKFKVYPDGHTGYQIKSDADKLLTFMKECFDGLNEATEKWNWKEKYNYEITKAIQHELFPDIPMKPYKERKENA